jgi:hypothetical protein
MFTISVTFVQCTKVQTLRPQIRVWVQRSVKIGPISGRMTVQFDNNSTGQTKVYGWVELFVGSWTRCGGIMAVTCVDVKETDTSTVYERHLYPTGVGI